jgi:hypothetical protein
MLQTVEKDGLRKEVHAALEREGRINRDRRTAGAHP